MRAPTPSAAAELAVDDYRSVVEAVGSCGERLRRAMWGKFDLTASKLEQYKIRLQYLSPQNRLRENQQRLMELEEQLQFAMEGKVKDYRHVLGIYLEHFGGLSPLKKLNQGFSYVADKNGNNIYSVSDTQAGEKITISVTDGIIDATVESIRKEDRNYG